MLEKRRRTSIEERLTPCECCNHPITNRHHILSFSVHGEIPVTMQLCSNCHELFHVAYTMYVKRTKRSKEIWWGFVNVVGKEDWRVIFITRAVKDACAAEFDYFIRHSSSD